MGRRFLSFVILLLLLDGLIGAQEQSTISRQRRLLLFFDFEDPRGYDEIERRLLYESLLFKISSADAPFQLVESRQRATDTEEALTASALEQNCDAWLLVKVLGTADNPSYRLWSWDLAARKQVIDQTFSYQTALRQRDLERRFWDEAVALAVANFQAVELGTHVTLRGIPGTEVKGLPDSPHVLDENGVLALVLPNPSLYTIRATERDHEPVNMTFNLRDNPVEIDLEQETAPRWVVEGGLTTLNFLSGAGSYYPIPNYLFIKASLTTYLLGYYLGGDQTDEPTFFQSRPLTNLGLHVGYYFNPPEARIRFYGSLGGILRVVHGKRLWGLEPIAPFGAQLTGGSEMVPWEHRKLRTFFEWAPTWYFADDPSLLGGSYPSYYQAINATVVKNGLIDYLNYRVGVRFPL